MSSSKLQDVHRPDPVAGIGGATDAPRLDDFSPSRALQAEVLALFDDCSSGLRRYVRSFGLGAEATEDVLQDVFLSLFRHLRLGRPRSNLQGWLFKVAHNLALKQRRKRHRRQQTESDWDAALAGRGSIRARIPRSGSPPTSAEPAPCGGQSHSRTRSPVSVFARRGPLLPRYRGCARISLGSVAKSLARAVTRLSNADRE